MVASGLGIADADGDVRVWDVGVEAGSLGVGVQAVGTAGRGDGVSWAQVDAVGRRCVLMLG